MNKRSFVRTFDDIVQTVRVIATLFDTDKVFIIGSQSILLSWPDAPALLRTSGEIDAYPENAKLWEVERKRLDPEDEPEASEEINALFGEGSTFHRDNGFYIDGVDENTARLPSDWTTRAICREVDVNSRTVLAVAPCPDDIIVSKLARFAEKDKEFIETYHSTRPLDADLIKGRIQLTKMDTEIRKRATEYLSRLTAASKTSEP